MAVGALLRFARDTFFSKPSVDRELAKLVRKQRVKRIVELGIGSLQRTEEVLKAAGYGGADGVTYCGIDPFEQRDQAVEPLSLIAAHRSLTSLPATVRLVPGNPTEALAAIANTLSDSDLIVLPDGADDDPGSPIWFYLPRMCHPGTLVVQLRQIDAETQQWRQWPLVEIEGRAIAARDGETRLPAAA